MNDKLNIYYNGENSDNIGGITYALGKTGFDTIVSDDKETEGEQEKVVEKLKVVLKRTGFGI